MVLYSIGGDRKVHQLVGKLHIFTAGMPLHELSCILSVIRDAI